MRENEGTQDIAANRQQICPECQATIPVHADFLPWCDKCGWNLKPQEPNRPLDVFEQIQVTLGEKYSQALFEELLSSDAPKPTLTISMLLALVLAVLVNLIPVCLLVLGIWLLLQGDLSLLAIFTTPAATLSGLVCLGLAVYLLPRPSKLPTSVASRKRFATIYRLVADAVEALDAPKVDGIVLEADFNAAFGRFGWQGKRFLFLGLPLLSILDDQEKVALLGHELAHSVNRDPARSLLIGTAIKSLKKWYHFLRPWELATSDFGADGTLLIPVNLVRLGLSELVRLPLYGLCYLLWRDSQRAEYLADYLAATIGGTEANVACLEKSLLSKTWHQTVQRVSLDPNRQDLFAVFQERAAQVPQRELERILRVEQMEKSHLGAVHPPTAHRIEFLRAHPVAHPKVTLSPADAADLEKELDSIKEEKFRPGHSVAPEG